MARRQWGLPKALLAVAAKEILHVPCSFQCGMRLAPRPPPDSESWDPFSFAVTLMPNGAAKQKPSCLLRALWPLGLQPRALRAAADSWLSQGPAHPYLPLCRRQATRGHMREA